MIPKTTPTAAGGRRTSAGLLRGRRRALRRLKAERGPHNERVRLITFVWSGQTGEQPVIFAARSWLQ